MAALPDIKTLTALREAEASCTRCPLYKSATQVVPGEGPARARRRGGNDLERAIVKPALVVALGATAAYSLLGRSVTISRMRGEMQSLADGMPLLLSPH